MDVKGIQQVYLRAMYTGTPETPTSEEEAFVITHCSPERLAVERAARVRNLRTVLHDDMLLLKKKLDKASLLPHVNAYAKSEWFWKHRGRTLIEDFCLFFVEHASASPVHRLLARIEGVCSGLSASTSARSPWVEHLTQQDGNDVVEKFVAPFALSFSKIFDEQSGYQPIKRTAHCVVRKAGQKIHIKFSKE